MAKKAIEVEALKHREARRLNIPTAEFESVMREEEKAPVRLAYERRNRDLDPQLVWRIAISIRSSGAARTMRTPPT